SSPPAASQFPSCLREHRCRRESLRDWPVTALHVSPPEFRVLAGRVTELAAELYERLEAARAYPQTSGTQTRQAFDEPVPQEGLKAAALDALTHVVEMSRLPTSRFFGYVLGSGEPVAALADLLASVLN